MAKIKKALICGISGQDGSYLAKLLLAKGYEVHGTARDAQVTTFPNLIQLNIRNKITCHSMALNDFRRLEAIRFLARPVKLYNAGSSECFGNTDGVPADESTPFRPRSQYAVAKATAVDPTWCAPPRSWSAGQTQPSQ